MRIRRFGLEPFISAEQGSCENYIFYRIDNPHMFRLYHSARLHWNSLERARGEIEDALIDDTTEWAMWHYAIIRQYVYPTILLTHITRFQDESIIVGLSLIRAHLRFNLLLLAPHPTCSDRYSMVSAGEAFRFFTPDYVLGLMTIE